MSTIDVAKLAKLQAQAASNRIGTSTLTFGGPNFRLSFIFCGFVLVRLLLTAHVRAWYRREGDRAAKNRAQVETCERTGRQEAPGCAKEAERAADHGRGGGQHVQGGRKRVALQCSQG